MTIKKSDNWSYLTMNVPVKLIELCFRSSKIKHLEILVGLKLKYGGLCRQSKTMYIDIASLFDYKSTKTVVNKLKELEALGWISIDTKGNFFIRSFDNILLRNRIVSTSSFKVSISQLKIFKKVAFAAVMTTYINAQRMERRRLEPKRRGSQQYRRHHSEYFPLACRGLSKLLHCSLGQAFKLRKMAITTKLVSVKKSFIETGWSVDNIDQYRKSNPEVSHLVAVIEGKIVIRQSDMFNSKIVFVRRKKVNYNKGGSRRITLTNSSPTTNQLQASTEARLDDIPKYG